MGSEGRAKCSGVVFGSCNNNFTRFRKYRYWDSKVSEKLTNPGIYYFLLVVTFCNFTPNIASRREQFPKENDKQLEGIILVSSFHHISAHYLKIK